MKSYAHYGIPEYWIIDPVSGALEQYVLSDHYYEKQDVYTNDEAVVSKQLPCVAFSMKDVLCDLVILEPCVSARGNGELRK